MQDFASDWSSKRGKMETSIQAVLDMVNNAIAAYSQVDGNLAQSLKPTAGVADRLPGRPQ